MPNDDGASIDAPHPCSPARSPLPALASFDLKGCRGGRFRAQAITSHTPQPGDIVSCYFPFDESPKRPGPRPRPGLVMGLRHDAAILFLDVAYGTSQCVEELQPPDLAVLAEEDWKKAGLHMPTKFVIGRRRMLPYVHGFFRAEKRGSPILGSLPAPTLENHSGRTT